MKTERNNKRWSTEEDDLLLSLTKFGKKRSIIASRLGRTKASVYARLTTLNNKGVVGKSDQRLIKTKDIKGNKSLKVHSLNGVRFVIINEELYQLR